MKIIISVSTCLYIAGQCPLCWRLNQPEKGRGVLVVDANPQNTKYLFEPDFQLTVSLLNPAIKISEWI